MKISSRNNSLLCMLFSGYISRTTLSRLMVFWLAAICFPVATAFAISYTYKCPKCKYITVKSETGVTFCPKDGTQMIGLRSR